MSNTMQDKIDGFGDERLVGLAQQGDLEAFAELARRLQERVFRTIFGMTRNQQDADDLTQETFMYAYKALAGFKQKSRFSTWIYRIAVNLTLNFLKKKGREKVREDFREQASVLNKSEYAALTPEGDSLKNELRSKLNEAIDSLPLAYKASFNLVVLQGISHGQAAEILGCSENTISWRMHKARQMLQVKLKPYFPRG